MILYSSDSIGRSLYYSSNNRGYTISHEFAPQNTVMLFKKKDMYVRIPTVTVANWLKHSTVHWEVPGWNPVCHR